LDARLSEFSPVEPVLSRGVIPAMYSPVAGGEVVPPESDAPPRFAKYRWYIVAALAAAWLILRLALCRKARFGTGAAASETAASMTLYSLAMFPKWGEFMMDTGITPFVLFAGIGLLFFPRSLSASRRKILILTHAVIGVLPWVPGCGWCWLPFFGWLSWFRGGSAVFTGLRFEDRRAALTGAVFGLAAGGALFWILGSCGGWGPVCAAVLLLIPSWLRR